MFVLVTDAEKEKLLEKLTTLESSFIIFFFLRPANSSQHGSRALLHSLSRDFSLKLL